MITLVPVTTQNVLLFKSVCLQTPQDTPRAFGSTYARDAAFTDADSIEPRRIEQVNRRLLPSTKTTVSPCPAKAPPPPNEPDLILYEMSHTLTSPSSKSP